MTKIDIFRGNYTPHCFTSTRRSWPEISKCVLEITFNLLLLFLLLRWHYRVWSPTAASTTAFHRPRSLTEPWDVTCWRTLSTHCFLGLPWGCLLARTSLSGFPSPLAPAPSRILLTAASLIYITDNTNFQDHLSSVPLHLKFSVTNAELKRRKKERH